ncbi:Imm50 family immunity protein [Kitasatospora sp. LaBMicrA B282]|uniref:Imm50 family immunity protein n=1 Tax=Kitasatospora sp. LaBMicrA B282 TaxID=3420949 RepID=UPI003D100F72
MTPAWADLLRNPEKLSGLYEQPADLDPLVLHSVHLDRRGPTVTLRLSTTRLPEQPPAEWSAAGCDHVEFHLQFLAVAELSLTPARFPAPVGFRFTEPEPDRIRVRLRGAELDLAFAAHRSVTIGRLSAWSAATAPAPGEQPVHHYLSPLDRRLHTTPPPTWKKNYYGRI